MNADEPTAVLCRVPYIHRYVRCSCYLITESLVETLTSKHKIRCSKEYNAEGDEYEPVICPSFCDHPKLGVLCGNVIGHRVSEDINGDKGIRYASVYALTVLYFLAYAMKHGIYCKPNKDGRIAVSEKYA